MTDASRPTEPLSKTAEQKQFEQIGRLSQLGRLGAPLLERLFGRWLTPPNQKDWVTDAEWARIQQEPTQARALLYAIVITIALLLIWAAHAPLNEVARGDGKVIPSQQLQVVQSIDGGIVKTIAVREGQVVEPGQLLVSLDSTRFVSSFRESQAKYLAVSAEVSRLKALTQGSPLVFGEDVLSKSPELVERETTLYRTSQDELEGQIAIHQRQLEQRQQDLEEAQATLAQYTDVLKLSSQELAVTRPLLESGAVSQVDVIRLERDVSNARGEVERARAAIARSAAAIEEAKAKMDEVEVRMLNRWRSQLAESSAQLTALMEAESGLADRVQQTEIRAPVRGTIQRLLTNTVGGVVTPGKDVVEIIPLDDQLIVEARIPPQDIAFIHPGQEAMIKFTAYDFAVFGGLEAHVEHISADTLTDDRDNTYYLVRLKTISSGFAKQNLAIIPGMTAQVDITTGQKTVLEYLLKPVIRATSQALSER